MTSTAFLRTEVQAHSAIAVAGRIRLALGAAGLIAGLYVKVAYIPFQAFRIWRKMRALVKLIEERQARPISENNKPSPEEIQHALTALSELHETTRDITHLVRSAGQLRMAYGPMLGAIERDNETLRDFIVDAEMRLSPEFQSSVQSAIAGLKPPTGADWKTSLESMRH